MLSLQHGQNLNLTALGNSLGVSGHTIRHYLEILQGTFHVRLLEPWQKNEGKRLVMTPKADYSFYRTSNGAEIDLVIESGRHLVAIETKASTAPVLTKGFWSALDDLIPTASFVAAPVEESYELRTGVRVANLSGLLARLETILGA